MDKYDLILNIIEHPENYSPQRLKEVFSDEETREIYNTLCKTRSAVESQKLCNSDEEWQKFQSKHLRPKFRFLWLNGRAATITAIAASALAATAIGLSIKMALPHLQDATPLPPSDIATTKTDFIAVSSDSITVTPDTTTFSKKPIIFEDATLVSIMKSIADTYGVTTEFRNSKIGQLHLYYRFDPSLSLEETIGQLNTFNQINIRINDKTLIIE